MAEFFDNPPVLSGPNAQQLQQLYNYLFTVSNKLNEAMAGLSAEELVQRVEMQIRTGGSGSEAEEQISKQYDTLKSLIIKTATIVRTEMTEISTELERSITAISEEFGTYEENLSAEIRAGAEGILQEYHYDERITGVEGETGNFIRKTNQYIFTGLVNPTTLEYGIAIGDGVTAYDANGNPYLNTDRRCATFTKNEMAFWQGDAKLAYFSSGKFYITNGEITNSLQIGDFIWKRMTDGSLALLSV